MAGHASPSLNDEERKPMKDRMTGFTGFNGHQWDASHAQVILFILSKFLTLRALRG